MNGTQRVAGKGARDGEYEGQTVRAAVEAKPESKPESKVEPKPVAERPAVTKEPIEQKAGKDEEKKD